jgi:hypothetical protein
MITAYDIQDNLMALLLSICTQLPPEQSFLKITGERAIVEGRTRAKVDQAWIEGLRAEGMTLREIEAVTGYAYATIHRRLKSFKRAAGTGSPSM